MARDIFAELNPGQIIEMLGMTAHPEGGHYVETFRAKNDGRPGSTSIYFLLQAGEVSAWHRVDADEHWFWHAGAPIELCLAAQDNHQPKSCILGPDLTSGAAFQVTVPAFNWQSAKSLGEWTLVSCVVAPGFSFDGFELAAPGWHPGD